MDHQAVKLADLHFGRDDAESDITTGLLRQGFVPTAAYQAAVSGRKSLIIGRKGAGKSAICRLLDSGYDHELVTCVITPDDAAGDELRRFELQGITAETAKSLVWRYVFAIQIARHLVSHATKGHKRRLRRVPATVRRLRRFLNAHHEGDDQKLYNRILVGARRLQSASFALGALGVNGSIELKDFSDGARASQQLDILEKAIGHAIVELGCQGRHPSFLLAVDQVEQVWSNDPSSDAMIVGLLLASKHISSMFDGSVRCVLFLRSDIYDFLQFADSDKFRGEEERIDWTPAMLSEVLLRRAQASLGMPVPAEQLWGEILPVTIGDEPVVDYLTSHTLLRPRDVIQLLNACRDTAVKHGHHVISAADVKSATRDFSRWKLQDLGNEYLINYPFLTRLYPMFQNTGYIITRGSLRTRFMSIRDTLVEQFPEYERFLDSDTVIDILFSLGFLGVQRGTAVVYGGAGREVIQPHETEFHLHPCFRSGLNSESAINLHPFERSVHDKRSWIGNVGLNQGILGLVTGLRLSKEDTLSGYVQRACLNIHAELGRAGLPGDARDEISRQLAQIQSAFFSSGTVSVREALEQAIETSDFLERMARSLSELGLAETPETVALIRTIRYEAERLRREAFRSTDR